MHIYIYIHTQVAEPLYFAVSAERLWPKVAVIDGKQRDRLVLRVEGVGFRVEGVGFRRLQWLTGPRS